MKPCPFCGGRAILLEKILCLDTGRYVICTVCGIKTSLVLIDHPSLSYTGMLDESTRYTDEQAAKIAADTWNRRA